MHPQEELAGGDPDQIGPFLQQWPAIVDRVMTWIEGVTFQSSGMTIPSDRLRYNEAWKREQVGKGRLSIPIAFAKRAHQVATAMGADDGPTTHLLDLLQGREMPEPSTLASAAEAVRRQLSQKRVAPPPARPLLTRTRSKFSPEKVATELRTLTARFDVAGNVLLAPNADRVAIAEVRECMALAGRILLQLVHNDVVQLPAAVPPWLRLSMRRFGRRPKFDGFVERAAMGVIRIKEPPSKTLRELIIHVLRYDPDVRKHPKHRRLDLDPTPFRHRQVFLEAISGWLRDALNLQPDIGPPIRRVCVEGKPNLPAENFDMCFDLLDEEARETQQFFLSVARCSSRACTLLADAIPRRSQVPDAGLTPHDSRRASALAAIAAWRSAVAPWREHVDLIPAFGDKPPRVLLRLAGLMAPPANGIAAAPCTIETDPNPSAQELMMMAGNPGVAAFQVLAEALADATGLVAIALEDFDFDNRRAVELKRSLLGKRRSPLVEQVMMIDDVHVEVERLELRCRKAPSFPPAAVGVNRPSNQRLLQGDAPEITGDLPEEPALGDPAAAEDPGTIGPEFNAIERAIVLLLRDGRNPRSMRAYAKEIGRDHSMLSRSDNWQKAWKAAKEAARAGVADLPSGSKDADGKLEAWREEEVCENCRLEPIHRRVIVKGTVVRMCEGCALKAEDRTKPRTN